MEKDIIASGGGQKLILVSYVSSEIQKESKRNELKTEEFKQRSIYESKCHDGMHFNILPMVHCFCGTIYLQY